MPTRERASAFLAAGLLVLASSCGGGDSGPTTVYSISVDTLYQSELSEHGQDTVVGTLRLGDGTPVGALDAAIAPDGTLYVLGAQQLYQADKATAVLTPIGPNPFVMNGLAADASRQLYGASGSLYQIDAGDGVATAIGSLGNSRGSSGDLVFTADGTLWIALWDDATHDDLATVDTATGLATPRFEIPPYTWGLSAAGKLIYCFSAFDDTLHQINTVTGTVTRVRDLSFTPYGST